MVQFGVEKTQKRAKTTAEKRKNGGISQTEPCENRRFFSRKARKQASKVKRHLDRAPQARARIVI